ncbi:hypothetical protein Ciccas_003615 [Cichlidogyrus casuarinus]|uniref:PDZ domain-containing protein n=1 Tax=Cichlidogyrus casuarinus TaxID=1844966 RepID=A0ABD2QER7_9PLAT
MSSSGLTNLKWINNLECDFDKSFMQLENLLRAFNLSETEVLTIRKHLSMMASSFSHVLQRAQAQIKGLEHDNEVINAEKLFAENELQDTILNFHRSQLETLDDSTNKDTIKAKLSYFIPKTILGPLHCKSTNLDRFKKQDKQLKQKRNATIGEFRLRACLELIRKENRSLNKYISSIQNELYGARLASKYLDKELAGRIQQIQLLNQKISAPDHEKLWNTLESEIYLHRHKSVSRACRVRKNHGSTNKVVCNSLRKIIIERKPSESLGISITGGLEHGVPIMISEIVPGHVVSNYGLLFVGDALLAVNGIDLRDKFHAQAVKILSSLQIGFPLFDLNSTEELSLSGYAARNQNYFIPPAIKYPHCDLSPSKPQLVLGTCTASSSLL